MDDNLHIEIVQKCLGILAEIDRICKANDIKYFAYAGTLLGAVRHKGLIPWDDDIDVVMLRKDYEKFAEVCKTQLSDGFELQTIYTDPLTSNPWMKLHDVNTAFISGVRRKGCMEGINIDIFPVDNAPDDEKERAKRAKKIDKINSIYEYRFAAKNKNDSIKMKLFKFAINLIPPLNEQKFKEKYDKYIQACNDKETKDVVYFSNRKYMRKVIDRHVFDETVYLPFEDTEIPAPVGYLQVLEGLYGKNYMELPPEDQRVTVHGNIVIDTNKSWKEYEEAYEYERV